MVGRLVVVLLGVTSVAIAEPKATVPPVIGAVEAMSLSAPAGFIDEAVTFEDGRLAYVIADAAEKAELHVVTLADKQEVVVDLAPVTSHPIAMHLVGKRLFVVGLAEDGKQRAALVELAGKKPGAVVYRLGPATHISAVTRDGKPRVIVHKATTTKTGTSHQVDLIALETGQRLAAGRPLELDEKGFNKPLEFRVNHWSDGMSHALGVKGGEWDKKEDTRSPDVEATYDLVTGKVIDRQPIGDLFEQRKRFQALADAGGKLDFLRVSWDNASIQIWRAGKSKPIELDQPMSSYDPKSLDGVVDADGSAWFALKIDPVNPDAVARKKADPEYLDIFHVDSSGKALRKARVLATGVRHRFGVLADGRFWLFERSPGFDRGGKSITLYQLQ